MTPFTIVWLPDAEDQLAALWLQARDRGDISAAQSRIDAELAFDPAKKGAPVAEGLRQVTVAPLKAFYEVHESESKVEVTAVTRVP